MTTILLNHAEKYPLMQPRDAVKLLYQSEFGGGHLIRDAESCLAFLRQEYAATPQDAACPLLEEIGSGMVRVQLAALDGWGYGVDALGRDFLRSASRSRGSMAGFREKLSTLSTLTRTGAMPFSPEALAAYLGQYEAAGFPPVSHSDIYRKNYRPAYRVVEKACLWEKYRMR